MNCETPEQSGSSWFNFVMCDGELEMFYIRKYYECLQEGLEVAYEEVCYNYDFLNDSWTHSKDIRLIDYTPDF